MAPNPVLELQHMLFKRVGLDTFGLTQESNPRHKAGVLKGFSRKDERKAERAQKTGQRYSRQTRSNRPTDNLEPAEEGVLSGSSGQSVASGEDDFGSAQLQPSLLHFDESERGSRLSKSMLERLAQDDAEIEALERKLGIKKNSKSLPKAFQDDGLDDLVGNSVDKVSDNQNECSKRKRDFDEWLSSKRRTVSKAGIAAGRPGADRAKVSSNDDLVIDLDESGASGSEKASPHLQAGHESVPDGEDGDDESCKGCEPDDDLPTHVPSSQRENPYVAPTAGSMVARYIPPSQRTAPSSENETRDRLHKQIRGQINRLTDSNVLSIAQSIDDIYQRNARGDVTELLADAIMAQLCRPESLPDHFFVLMGGFSAAIYKIIGLSFGSHLVRRVVNDFGHAYEMAREETDDQGFHRKESCNFITFLTQLYVFEVVGCRILFDYMERLLQEISELNVELLVRVCRMVGRLLRRDDPQALKHVSWALSQALPREGHANVSARTRFMIDIINDLKNGRPKAKGLGSAVISGYVLRMSKRLGELKSQLRRLDGLAAMGMSLGDVEGADIHGKWWLVGASVPASREASERAKSLGETRAAGPSDPSDDEDMDFALPDYPIKARAQGLVTGAQITIFTAIMSANSHEQGYQQYARLKLKKDEQLELARVLVQCVGSETEYNEYYGLDRLWKLFRSLGESLFGEGADWEETGDGERMKDERRVRHVARFYASLVAQGALTISILKPLELLELNRTTAAFVECFMVSLLQECRGMRAVEDASIEKAFGPARELPSLAAGIYWFLGSKVRKSKLVDSKRLVRVTEKALVVVQATTIEGGY